MGVIISSRAREGNKVVFEINVDYDEALQLKGHLDDAHIFSEHAADTPASISERGKNEATKYFLIPRELRADLKPEQQVRCQRVEHDRCRGAGPR